MRERGGGGGPPLPHGDGDDARGPRAHLPQLDGLLHVFVIVQGQELRRAAHTQRRAQEGGRHAPPPEELGSGGGFSKSVAYIGPSRREGESVPHVTRARLILPAEERAGGPAGAPREGRGFGGNRTVLSRRPLVARRRR